MLRLTIRLNIGERTISDLSEPLLGRTLDQEFEQSREGLRLLRAFGEAEKFHLAPQAPASLPAWRVPVELCHGSFDLFCSPQGSGSALDGLQTSRVTAKNARLEQKIRPHAILSISNGFVQLACND
jgi:hypothetical protein